MEWVETSVGVICDTRIAARVKGKVYKPVVRASMINGLEVMAKL